MTEADAFLADIIEHPADDTPRLIFADWLEDNGDGERAEFIRASIATHKAPTQPHNRVMTWREYNRLADRARELLLCNWREWTPRLSPDKSFELILSKKWAFMGTPAVEFARGFISLVHCSLAAWLEHGPALVRRQPVERVELPGVIRLTMSPIVSCPTIWQGMASHHNLPGDLFALFAERLGIERCRNNLCIGADVHLHAAQMVQAEEILSAVALAWARDPARLDPKQQAEPTHVSS